MGADSKCAATAACAVKCQGKADPAGCAKACIGIPDATELAMITCASASGCIKVPVEAPAAKTCNTDKDCPGSYCVNSRGPPPYRCHRPPEIVWVGIKRRHP